MSDWLGRGVTFLGSRGLFDNLGQKQGGKSKGLVASIPFEAHIPGYQFCGPGTKYSERVRQGQMGINALDNACMRHDAVYNSAQEETAENRKRRRESDDILIQEARRFRNDSNNSWDHRLAGYATEQIMGVKRGLNIF